jgi:hypothetical protein
MSKYLLQNNVAFSRLLRGLSTIIFIFIAGPQKGSQDSFAFFRKGLVCSQLGLAAADVTIRL